MKSWGSITINEPLYNALELLSEDWPDEVSCLITVTDRITKVSMDHHDPAQVRRVEININLKEPYEEVLKEILYSMGEFLQSLCFLDEEEADHIDCDDLLESNIQEILSRVLSEDWEV